MFLKSTVYLFFTLLLSSYASGQNLPLDPETKKTAYQETISIDSLTKELLYERCKEWMINYYKSSKFDLDDKSSKLGREGYFIIFLTYDYKYKNEYNITYNISMMQKEGKYRYLLTDFMIYDVKTGPKTAQTLEAFYQKLGQQSKGGFITQLNKEVGDIINNMKPAILSGLSKDEDDW